jgi:hypothetical protein
MLTHTQTHTHTHTHQAKNQELVLFLVRKRKVKLEECLLDKGTSPLMVLLREVEEGRRGGEKAEEMLAFLFEKFPEMVRKVQRQFPSFVHAVGEVGGGNKNVSYHNSMTFLAVALRGVSLCVCV